MDLVNRILLIFSVKNLEAPNEKKEGKGLECSFVLSRIVLWPFKGIFARANIISSVRMPQLKIQMIENCTEWNFIPRN